MCPTSDHDNAYAGLLVDDLATETHWAFGTGFEDPLAGLDAAVPEGVDPSGLATYCLMLGDDALVMSQRLAEWCSRAPDLEEDIALANVALDLLGQARFLLVRAAQADPSLVPDLPQGSPVPPEDRLAFFRDDREFRNVRLVELPRGDFAETVARLLLFSTWRLALMQRLVGHRDPVLAAIAAKAVKELAYHRDFAARWFVILALGTEESRRRALAGLAEVWRFHDELFESNELEARVATDPAALRDEVDELLDSVLRAADLGRPDVPRTTGVLGRGGRDGMHTEALSLMLAELQSVARAHPQGRW